MAETFHDRLRACWRRSDSALCVGLDPTLERLPARGCQPLYDFCRAIVDATADLVCAFKPQFAHFAAEAAEDQLAALIEHIHEQHPGVPVILDAKRGDIGSTSELYARELFDRYGADAATVNPYLGWDAVAPFAARAGKGVALLCHTSNPDGAWLQEHPPNQPAYLRVAELAGERDQGNLMLVVGATYPEQLRAVRRRVPDMPLLVPGVGAQGGDVAAVFRAGQTEDGAGLVVNASRAVLFAGEGADFARAARRAARSLRDDMRRAREAALSRDGGAGQDGDR